MAGKSWGFATTGRRDSNLDERLLHPFDVGMYQIDSAHRERKLLGTQSRLRSWNFAAERDGAVNALNFDSAPPGPRIALQRTPYSGH